MPDPRERKEVDEDALPRWFGSRYLLLRPLGEGGMGKVFLAYSGRRLCAVKVKRSDRDDAELTSRFLAESRLATKLSHRNLVYVTESGEEAGKIFLAMEYVRGKTLQQILSQCARRRFPLPLEFSLFVARELLQALDYLHTNPDLQVTHRDLSPTNVMLSYDGSVKVIDFGLAFGPDQPSSPKANAGAGQRRYMAPEQVAGQPADHLSDLFSAGVLLWEMVTGRPLFPNGASRTATDPIPTPSSVAPDIHPQLDAIVMTALAVTPSDRYPGARQFIKDIDEQLSRHDSKIVSQTMGQLFTAEQQAEVREEKQLVQMAEAMALAAGVEKGTATADHHGGSRSRRFLQVGLAGALGGVVLFGCWIFFRSALRPPPQDPLRLADGSQVGGDGSAGPKSLPPERSEAPGLVAAAPEAPVSNTRSRTGNEAARPVQLSPRSAQSQRAALALERAESLYRRDHLTEASFAAQSALASSPLEANLMLGKIYLQSRRLDESILHFKAALRLDPNSALAEAGLNLAEGRKAALK